MAHTPAIETIQETIQVEDVKPQISLPSSQTRDPGQSILFSTNVSDYSGKCLIYVCSNMCVKKLKMQFR